MNLPINGFLYILTHPSNKNLLKIGITRRDPYKRLKEHNNQYDKALGKIVKDTGQLWEMEKYFEVEDVYLAEHVFWKRSPLTELPYSFSNELLDISHLGPQWVEEGLEVALQAGARKNPFIAPVPKQKPKRGTEWIKKQLVGTGIKPVKGYGNGVVKVWFRCELGHEFKIGAYRLVGGYQPKRRPVCPVCHPSSF